MSYVGATAGEQPVVWLNLSCSVRGVVAVTSQAVDGSANTFKSVSHHHFTLQSQLGLPLPPLRHGPCHLQVSICSEKIPASLLSLLIYIPQVFHISNQTALLSLLMGASKDYYYCYFYIGMWVTEVRSMFSPRDKDNKRHENVLKGGLL